MNLNLKQLEAFVRVAELASFRKAAEQLHTTQPTISARIAALETSLDTQLLLRDSGSVELTQRGRELLDHARDVLQATERLAQAAGKPASADGILRLGVTELPAMTWLRDFLRQLKLQFPNISVELTVDLAINLSRDFNAGSLDLVLQSEPFPLGDNTQLPLGEFQFNWFAAPALIGDDAAALDIPDLGAWPLLLPSRNTRIFEQVREQFASARGDAARLVPSSHLQLSLQMALDAMGVALLPDVMVKAELAAGTLLPVACAWQPNPLPFAAIYHAERVPGFVVQAARMAQQQV